MSIPSEKKSTSIPNNNQWAALEITQGHLLTWCSSTQQKKGGMGKAVKQKNSL